MNITMLEELIAHLDTHIQQTEDLINDLKKARELLRQRIVLILRSRGENLP